MEYRTARFKAAGDASMVHPNFALTTWVTNDLARFCLIADGSRRSPSRATSVLTCCIIAENHLRCRRPVRTERQQAQQSAELQRLIWSANETRQNPDEAHVVQIDSGSRFASITTRAAGEIDLTVTGARGWLALPVRSELHELLAQHFPPTCLVGNRIFGTSSLAGKSDD